MRNLTICGAPLEAFAKSPTPRELARIVAALRTDTQAAFFVELGAAMHDCDRNNLHAQARNLAGHIAELEEELLDGSASTFLRRVADYLVGMNRDAAE